MGHTIDQIRVDPPAATIRAAPEAPIQRELYTAQTPLHGVTPAVGIQEEGTGYRRRLQINDRTVGRGTHIGVLDGYLTYSIEPTRNEVTLYHIETHPPRLGLGSILMYHLALVANRSAKTRIVVATPAHTAVEAYRSLGAVATNPVLAAVQSLRYYDHYTEVGGPDTPKSAHGVRALNPVLKQMVNEEANQRLERDKYYNPNMTQRQEAAAKDQYLLQAMSRLGTQQQEARRQGNIRGLALTGLEFQTAQLLINAGNRVNARWAQATLPTPNIMQNHF